jgi:hypothetical protein
MKQFLLALTLSAASLFGADVTGTWSGTLEFNREGETRSTPAMLVLKQESNKISGSIGPNADRRYTIKSGNIEGNKLTIEVEPDDRPAKVLMTLTLDGDDRITGDFKAETDEGAMTGKLDVKREK